MLIAQRTDLDRWLQQHPAVLGGGAIAIGLLLAVWGAGTMVSRDTVSNWGMRVEGGTAQMYGAIRLIGGVCLIIFGTYKLFAG